MKRSPLHLLAALLTFCAVHALAGLADRTLEIYWVDVEGGGATLIVTPAGESVLIDSGNPFERDPGRIHQVAAEVAGLKKIDHLVTTHFHVDHFGGAAELSALIAIGQVHDKNIRPDAENNTADEFIANLDENCAANYLKLTVAPDGKSYTVAIPATGQARTFQTKITSAR